MENSFQVLLLKIKDHKETSQTGNFHLEDSFSPIELPYKGITENIPFYTILLCSPLGTGKCKTADHF